MSDEDWNNFHELEEGLKNYEDQEVKYSQQQEISKNSRVKNPFYKLRHKKLKTENRIQNLTNQPENPEKEDINKKRRLNSEAMFKSSSCSKSEIFGGNNSNIEFSSQEDDEDHVEHDEDDIEHDEHYEDRRKVINLKKSVIYGGKNSNFEFGGEDDDEHVEDDDEHDEDDDEQDFEHNEDDEHEDNEFDDDDHEFEDEDDDDDEDIDDPEPIRPPKPKKQAPYFPGRPYTPLENKTMIDILINDDIIEWGSKLGTWRIVAERRFKRLRGRTERSLHNHFMRFLLPRYHHYTNDPEALARFELLYEEAGEPSFRG